MMNFEEWYNKVKTACQGHEADNAYSAWRKWDEMITLVPAALKDEMMQIKETLLFTAFPSLPVNQAVEIIEKQLLNLISGEVDVDEIIHNRFLYLGYGNQEDDRRAFREAVLHNEQKLGEKTVAQWVQAFDTMFPPEEREENAATTFFTRNSSIASMSKAEQNFLHRTLRVYDQWFASPITTIYDAAVIYKKLNELERAGVKGVNMKTFRAQYLSSSARSSGDTSNTTNPRSVVASPQNVSLPLLQALSKYEDLGNQLITEGRIKVKSQSEPVRPSLLYWLKYYRDELGIGQHSSVERGDFLFRSENCRKLTAKERERVNLILKSVEENLPLSIDLERQEIIFPVFRDVVLAHPDVLARGDARSAAPERSLSGRAFPDNVFPVRNTPMSSIPGEPAFAWSPPPVPLASMIPRDEPVRIPGGFASPAVEQNELPRAKAIGTPVFFVPKPEEGEVYPAQVKSTGSNMPRQNENRSGQAFGASEVSFSTGHIFPAEKEAAENRAVVTKNAAALPMQPQPVPQKFSSFRISPVSLGGKNRRNGDDE